MAFHAALDTLSVISQQQLTLFHVKIPLSHHYWARTLKCLAQGHSHERPSGSNGDHRITSPTCIPYK